MLGERKVSAVLCGRAAFVPPGVLPTCLAGAVVAPTSRVTVCDRAAIAEWLCSREGLECEPLPTDDTPIGARIYALDFAKFL